MAFKDYHILNVTQITIAGNVTGPKEKKLYGLALQFNIIKFFKKKFYIKF